MKKQTDWDARRFRAENPDNPPCHIVGKGRVRWALEALMGAGAGGVTPITTPAPRWAAMFIPCARWA